MPTPPMNTNPPLPDDWPPSFRLGLRGTSYQVFQGTIGDWHLVANIHRLQHGDQVFTWSLETSSGFLTGFGSVEAAMANLIDLARNGLIDYLATMPGNLRLANAAGGPRVDADATQTRATLARLLEKEH